MFTKSMQFSALLTVATMTQAAVPGEIIAVVQIQSPSASAVVSPDGSNLTYLPCVGDPTRGGVPRFFLSVGGGGNVLHTHPEGDRRVADRWSNELAAADEDCVQSVILSNEGNKVITDRKWSPDGTMIGLSAEEYDPAANTLTHSGIYLADVVYTGNRPTGVTNFRQVVETSGNTALDWSPDSGKVVYGGAELRITSKTTTGSPVNVQACYSPVGQYLSFASGTYPSLNAPGGDRVLYRIKADGTGKPIKIIGAKGQSWGFNRWRR